MIYGSISLLYQGKLSPGAVIIPAASRVVRVAVRVKQGQNDGAPRLRCTDAAPFPFRPCSLINDPFALLRLVHGIPIATKTLLRCERITVVGAPNVYVAYYV